MARAYAHGKVLCAAVRPGIPDALEKGDQSLIELATAVASDPIALHRLLRALGSIGVVDESVPGRFVLTSFGEPLKRNSRESVWASVIFWADLLADAWTYLSAKIARDNSRVEEMVMSDLNMLAVTVGRERSEPEWAALLDSAGLTMSRIIPVGDTIHSIVEADIKS